MRNCHNNGITSSRNSVISEVYDSTTKKIEKIKLLTMKNEYIHNIGNMGHQNWNALFH
jgi:hypothetical protein